MRMPSTPIWPFAGLSNSMVARMFAVEIAPRHGPTKKSANVKSGAEELQHLVSESDLLGGWCSPPETQILDATDRRGLWLELNSGQKQWPDRPAHKLMVPWKLFAR